MWKDRPRPVVLAHRGDHERERENTLAAFDAGLVAGAHGIEFDVRMTSDGTLVVHHDAALRGARRRGVLRTLRARDLPRWVPTLKDVCAWAARWPGVLLDVEIKEPGLEGETVRLLRGSQLVDRSVVTSFHPDVCFQVREHFDGLATGLLVEEAPNGVVDLAVEAGVQALVLRRTVARRPLIEEATARGLEVWCWTVNRGAEARALVDGGVTGLITDRAERVLESLRRPQGVVGRPRTVLRRGRRGS